MYSSPKVWSIVVAFILATAGIAAADVSNVPQHAIAGRPTTIVAVTQDLPLFESEAAAQKHCPGDTVVWLNTKSGIYHLKG